MTKKKPTNTRSKAGYSVGMNDDVLGIIDEIILTHKRQITILESEIRKVDGSLSNILLVRDFINASTSASPSALSQPLTIKSLKAKIAELEKPTRAEDIGLTLEGEELLEGIARKVAKQVFAKPNKPRSKAKGKKK